MPAASRGKYKRHSIFTPSETSESSEESRTTSPEQMDISTTPTMPQEAMDSSMDSSTTTDNHENNRTVAMTVRKPRLTANGKRIGRPPGTFKTRERNGQNVLLANPTICRWNNCNAEFFSVAEIVEHMFELHTKEKATSCKWAGCDDRSFKSFYMLVGHIRTHTGERPMKCNHPGCLKAYKTRENLNTHMRTHTGEKPYQCQFSNCGKRFTNASDRGKHENRCHSDKKEYICDVQNCNKSYTDPSSLRKHVICVHGPEVQEKRKKVKVRWVYRRDGLKVENSGDSTLNDLGLGIQRMMKEDIQMEEPLMTEKKMDPMMSLFQAIETEDALMMEQMRRQSAAALHFQLQQPLQPCLQQTQPIDSSSQTSAFHPVIPRAPVLLANSSAPIDLNVIATMQAQAILLNYLNEQSAKQPATDHTVISNQVHNIFNQLMTPTPSPTMGGFNMRGAVNLPLGFSLPSPGASQQKF